MLRYGPRPRAWSVWYAARRLRHRGPRPAHYFRVRVSRRSRLFIHVEVYQTQPELVGASQWDRTGWTPPRLSAQCVEIVVRGQRSKRLRPDFAIIRLTAASRTGDITHEAFHATLRWARRQGVTALPIASAGGGPRQTSALEERCARVHETICIGLINGLYNCGYLRDAQ